MVTDGVEDNQDIGTKIYLRGKCSVTAYDREKEVLLKKGETVTCKIEIPQKVSAPVLKGEKLGRIAYYLDGKLIDFYPVYAEKSVGKISLKWYTEKVFHDFFHSIRLYGTAIKEPSSESCHRIICRIHRKKLSNR